MHQPLLFRRGWGDSSCFVIQHRVFVAVWGYLVVLGLKRGMVAVPVLGDISIPLRSASLNQNEC